MERDRPPHLENPAVISDQQLYILRLFGQGLGGEKSFKEIYERLGDQNGGIDVGRELKKIYDTFGVVGQTAAVVHALDNGLLKTSELVEEDFDWDLFKTLKKEEIAVLEAFTHARKPTLTEEEFNGLGIETVQAPKAYTSHSIAKSCDYLGLKHKTQAVVYYYAFLERQKEQGDLAVPAAEKILTEKNILTERQIRVLKLSAKGVGPSEIAKRLGVPRSTVISRRDKAVSKLKVHTVGEALGKVRQPSNL